MLVCLLFYLCAIFFNNLKYKNLNLNGEKSGNR
jgi:hypothetical protein